MGLLQATLTKSRPSDKPHLHDEGLKWTPNALSLFQSMTQGQKGDSGAFSFGQDWVWGPWEAVGGPCSSRPSLRPAPHTCHMCRCTQSGRYRLGLYSCFTEKSQRSGCSLGESQRVRPDLGKADLNPDPWQLYPWRGPLL